MVFRVELMHDAGDLVSAFDAARFLPDAIDLSDDPDTGAFVVLSANPARKRCGRPPTRTAHRPIHLPVHDAVPPSDSVPGPVSASPPEHLVHSEVPWSSSEACHACK